MPRKMSAPKRPHEEGINEPTAKMARRGFRVGPENLPDGPWKRKNDRVKKDLIDAAKVKKKYARIKARHLQTLSDAPSIPVPTSLAEGEGQPPAGPVAAGHTRLHDVSASESEWAGIEAEEDATGDRHRARQGPSPSATPFINPDRQAMMGHARGDDRGNTARHQQARPQQPGPVQHDGGDSSAKGPEMGGEDDGMPLTENQGLVATQERASRQEQYDKDHHQSSRQSNRPKRVGDHYFSKELAAAEKRKAEAQARAEARQAREEDRRRHMEERERYRRAMEKARAPGFRDGKRKLGRQSTLLLDRVKKLIQ